MDDIGLFMGDVRLFYERYRALYGTDKAPMHTCSFSRTPVAAVGGSTTCHCLSEESQEEGRGEGEKAAKQEGGGRRVGGKEGRKYILW